jgi:hypothetical protein
MNIENCHPCYLSIVNFVVCCYGKWTDGLHNQRTSNPHKITGRVSYALLITFRITI